MPINPPSGNMYPWAFTWNPLGGLCLHACSYCYVRNKISPWLKRMGILKYVGEPRLIESELKTPLRIPNDYILFVCSNNDLFGDWVDGLWIEKIILHCRKYPETHYLFQTKNPERLEDYLPILPENSIIGTTIETNRDYQVSKAPSVIERYRTLARLDYPLKMVSIEPIMDFDPPKLVKMVKRINPWFVSIGADSDRNLLPEPDPEKIKTLIDRLSEFTQVRIKHNLKRLLPIVHGGG